MKLRTKPYQTYKVLGLLLTYPTKKLIEALDGFVEILETEKLLAHEHIISIQPLIQWMKTTELLDLQEQYVSLFDRQPLLSLHLFEHVHGDSRERGQAMVDLKQRYEKSKMNLKENEMPDFLPVFLEYLSFQEAAVVTELLDEPINIMATLAKRLNKHDSLYESVFNVLLALSSTQFDERVVDKALENYKAREPTKEEIDQQWTEEAVSFCEKNKPEYEEKIISFEHFSKKMG